MNMKDAVSIIAGIVVSVVLGVFFRRRNHQSFDERQLKYRAEGYKTGYIITIMLLAVYMLMSLYGLLSSIETELIILIVMLTGIAVYAIYCIFNDSFFFVGQKGRSYMILCIAVMAINGLTSLLTGFNGGFLENGVMTFDRGCSLVFFITFFAITSSFFIKKIVAEREEEQ